MTAIGLALLAALAWGVSDTLGGVLSRRQHVLAVMFLARAASVVLLAVLVVVTDAPGIGDDRVYAILAGGVLFVAIALLYGALAIGPMSVVAPIFAAGAAVPAVWGFASGEAPGAVTVVALAVVVGGCVVAARAPGAPGMRADPRGVAYAAGAAVSIGVGFVLMDEAAEDGALAAVLIERVTEFVIAGILVVGARRRVRGQLRRPGLAPVVGIVDSTAQTLYVVASRTGLLPVVSVLASLYPVVTVLLARAFLGERLSRAQAAAALVTLLGVAVVAGTA